MIRRTRASAVFLVLLVMSAALQVQDDPKDGARTACGDPNSGDCFTPHTTPFCRDTDCCNIVCSQDSFCCEDRWDPACVQLAQQLCGPGGSNCCVIHPTPGCSDFDCEQAVCEADHFCCEIPWDSQCVTEARRTPACDCGGEPPEPPANDRIFDMVEIFDGLTSFTTVDATTDGPAHPGSNCDAFDDDQINQDIWYFYVATCTGDLLLDLCGSDGQSFADYDSRIAVYGPNPLMTNPAASFLDCNDDCSFDVSSTLTVPVTESDVYFIRIGGFDIHTGSGFAFLGCQRSAGACCDIDTGACLGDMEEFECQDSWSHFASCGAEPSFPPPACNQPPCGFDSGPPLDDFGAPFSQYASDFPFSGEAADDFILTGGGNEPCEIISVKTWVYHSLLVAPSNPANQWTGVTVTVYNDIPGVGPSGHRLDPIGGGFEGTVAHTEFVPMSRVSASTFGNCLDETWEIEVPVSMMLLQNVRYWLVIQPEFRSEFGDPTPSFGGGTSILYAENGFGLSARQIFPVFSLPDWTEVPGNAGTQGFCNSLSRASRRDLAFQLVAGCSTLGDFDGNGTFDGGDIQGFVQCLLFDSGPGECNCADFSGNQAADPADVPMFVEALLAQIGPPSIVRQPRSIGVCVGDDAVFSVGASSPISLHFQWFRDGSPVGSDSDTLLIANAQLSDDGAEITCEVSDEDDRKTMTNVATLSVLTELTVTGPLPDVNACEGADATFTVGTAGTATAHYQWFMDAEAIGADSPTLILRAVGLADDGAMISCVVTDVCGSNIIVTEGGLLLVFSSPAPPTNVAANPTATCAGEPTELSASTGGPQINWYAGACGQTLIGTGASLNVAPLTTTTYYARAQFVSNGCESPLCEAVTVIVAADDGAPTLDCPADAVVQCGAATTPDNTGAATAIDDCDPAPAVSFLDVDSGACPVEIERTWTVMDVSGNLTECVQRITVEDTTAPTIENCPSGMILPIAVNCSGTLPDLTGDVVAFDNCVGQLTIVQAPPAGAAVGPGEMNVTFDVTDPCGNMSRCVAIVSVVDAEPPSITCPGALTVSLDADCQFIAPDISLAANVSDNCTADDDLDIATMPADLTTLRLGRNPITVIVTDEQGNSKSCSTILSVNMGDCSETRPDLSPPQTTPSSEDCGSGMCAAGAGAMLPFMLMGWGALKRRRGSRRRSRRASSY